MRRQIRRIRPFLSLSLAALACVVLLPGCTSTPPTFVLAWTGTDSRVHTMQSTDGSSWVLPATAPGPNSTEGVAVAHNGMSAWLVLWNSGGQLSYITGIGGLPSATSSTGITWESAANALRTSPVTGTPALAYGNQKWVAVYLASGGLRIVRSVLESSSTRPADEDLGLAAATSFTPALTFGAGRFVLAYLDGTRNLVARTSSDGRSWSPPATVFPITDIGGSPASCISPTSVTLSFSEGAFYAVGRLSTTLCSGNSQAGGSSIAVFRSPDGASWTTLVDRNSGPTVIREEAGIPGAAFAQCRLVVAYTQTRLGTTPSIIPVPNQLVLQAAQPSSPTAQPPSCSSPASFTFGGPQTVSAAPAAKLDSVTSVVFGSGGT